MTGFLCRYALLALLLVAARAHAEPLVNTPAREAIDRGLAFLAKRQKPDGSVGGSSHVAAISSIAGLAFLSAGSTPAEGKYADNLKRLTNFVVSCSDPKTGYLAGHRGNMYGHGFATVFLAEVYGTTDDERVRTTLTQAVRLIENTQKPQGGWRYNPVPLDADLSVTICCLMGLRAARNAGIKVSKKTIVAAINYVKGCQNSDGGFSYMYHGRPLNHGGGSGFARTAAGLCSLFFCGIYEGKEVTHGLKYLRRFYRNPRGGHFEYAQYYASQAFHQAGGDDWRNYYTFMRDYLVKRQRADGSWSGAVSQEYCTAMALIVLQMPNELVPIFQR